MPIHYSDDDQCFKNMISCLDIAVIQIQIMVHGKPFTVKYRLPRFVTLRYVSKTYAIIMEATLEQSNHFSLIYTTKYSF